jgi:hypothetical protein
MNQLTRKSSTAPSEADLVKILSCSPLVATLLRCVSPEGTDYRPGVTITDEHRQALLADAAHIERFTEDRRPERVTALVSMLLTAFPHREVSSDAATLKLAVYKVALEDVPTWAVEEAAKRWIRGDVGDGGFAPTPPQLRLAARDIVAVALGKALTMRKLAAMPVQRDISEAERAATIAKVAKLVRPGKE